MDNQQVMDLLKLVWPLIVIQLAFQVFALVDIVRKRKTKNLSPAIWAIIVIFGEIIGSVIYYLVGRSEEE